jgi:membrane protein YqaA with SNARE-associated domain
MLVWLVSVISSTVSEIGPLVWLFDLSVVSSTLLEIGPDPPFISVTGAWAVSVAVSPCSSGCLIGAEIDSINLSMGKGCCDCAMLTSPSCCS